jgi:ribosome maturation protein Sdo1
MKVEGYSEKKKKDIVYPTHLSAMRPVSDNDVPTDSVEDLVSSLRVKNLLSVGTDF